MSEGRTSTRLPDRAQVLAEVFARLRHGAGSEFSTLLTAEMCQTVLEALGQPVGQAVDRIPSHRSDELPRYIEINRATFSVDAETLTGAQLRYLPNPPVPDDYDLWKLGVGHQDSLVQDDDVIDLRGGRFYTAPKFINAGAA